jgi:pyruvate dehydrogenase phosphatase
MKFVDTNVATHLIRMALSEGKGQQYLSRMLSMPSQLARRWRDDMTVQIVFFHSLKDKLPPTKVQQLQRCS